MPGPVTTEAVARRLSIGVVVVESGEVRWLNDAAQALGLPHGGSWSGAGSPVALLSEVRLGDRRVTVRWPSPVGGTRWWQVGRRTLGGGHFGSLFEITDETSRLRDNSGSRNAEWRLARLELMAGMGSWEWNTLSDRVDWSDSLLRLLGLPPGADMDVAAFWSLLHPDDLESVRNVLTEALRSTQPFASTLRVHTADRSSLRTLEFYGEVLTDAGGAPVRVLGTARDITEQSQARADLAFLAEHDPLTGIANRRRITSRLEELAASAETTALLLIDVDNFKDINDLRGHAVGDRVLRWLVRSMSGLIDPDALLGRLGGDEFAIVLPHCDEVDALDIAERLCDAVAGTPMLDVGAAMRVTLSIGVTTVATQEGAEVTLGRADLALYEAKNGGRNRARLFVPDHYQQALHRVSVVQRVSHALGNGAMGLDAQPVFDIASGRIVRYELLVRLRDGLEPAVGPSDFLPAAERSDLVLRLDRWVVRQAVHALASPRARALHLHFAVNVSARSLEEESFGTWILHQLQEAHVEPSRLGLEITETTAIGNLDAAHHLVTQLTGAGCTFALDDFGAGYGSFSHLKRLPFTTVKIAGEFVRHLDTDPVDRALVAAIVGVARQLGMTTVAEQVDRLPLLDVLRELGVRCAQGFYLGHPHPLDELLGDG